MVSELQVGLLLLFFHPLVSTVMVLSREVPFRVLGRSRQQGRTVMKTVDSAVFAVKDAGPRQPARGAGLPAALTQRPGAGSGGRLRGARGRPVQGEEDGGVWTGRRPGPGPRHRVDSRDESRMSSWWLALLESLSWLWGLQ